MKKMRIFFVLILFPIIGITQIKPVSELEPKPIIRTKKLSDFNENKKEKEKHLYIIFEKNKNSSIDSLGHGKNRMMFFYLLKKIPKENYTYRIEYGKNGELIKFIPGTLSWGMKER